MCGCHSSSHIYIRRVLPSGLPLPHTPTRTRFGSHRALTIRPSWIFPSYLFSWRFVFPSALRRGQLGCSSRLFRPYAGLLRRDLRVDSLHHHIVADGLSSRVSLHVPLPACLAAGGCSVRVLLSASTRASALRRLSHGRSGSHSATTGSTQLREREDRRGEASTHDARVDHTGTHGHTRAHQHRHTHRHARRNRLGAVHGESSLPPPSVVFALGCWCRRSPRVSRRRRVDVPRCRVRARAAVACDRPALHHRHRH